MDDAISCRRLVELVDDRNVTRQTAEVSRNLRQALKPEVISDPAMLRSPLKSPTVRALGVTVATFAVLGGASMVITGGVSTVVRFGLKQHRVSEWCNVQHCLAC